MSVNLTECESSLNYTEEDWVETDVVVLTVCICVSPVCLNQWVELMVHATVCFAFVKKKTPLISYFAPVICLDWPKDEAALFSV